MKSQRSFLCSSRYLQGREVLRKRKHAERERLKPQHRFDLSRTLLLWGSAADHGHARNYYYLEPEVMTLES